VIRRLWFRSQAESDIAHAYEWYEEQTPGQGEAFLFALKACVALIERMPQIFPRAHLQVRRALLRKFPYKVFYVVREDEIEVMAVVHVKRNTPKGWRV
jgi:plasmid stabilization system protein ParE